jgi:sodium-dependent phosphate transporter
MITDAVTVMKRKNPVKAALISVPIYFAFTAGLLTMLIVWKGASGVKLDGAGPILGTIFGVALGIALIVSLILLPYLYRLLALDDWQLKPWDMIYGPLLFRRGPVPPKPAGHLVSPSLSSTML